LCFNYASLFFRHSMQSATTWTKDTGEYIIQILQKGENDETYRIGALRLFRGCRI